jgi:hypothetical protein
LQPSLFTINIPIKCNQNTIIKAGISFLFDVGSGDGTLFVLLSPVKEKETKLQKKEGRSLKRGQTTLFPFLFGASNISQSHVDRQTLFFLFGFFFGGGDISSCRHAQRDRQQ